MLDIFDRIERDSGGPIGQYFSQAYGYYSILVWRENSDLTWFSTEMRF